MRLFKGLPASSLQQVPAQTVEHPLFTGATSVGLVTADNPRFPSVPGGHSALKRDLDSMGLQHQETTGRYGALENSFIVHGPTREQMYTLGKKYGQEAVIHSAGGRHEFIYTGGPNDGASHPSLPTHDYWPEGTEPPEDYYTLLPGQGSVRLHFDFDHVDRVPMMPAPAAPAAPLTKHELGHRLYKALKKAYEVADNTQNTDAGNTRLDPGGFAHPHAYDWHDGHTDHHYAGYCHGGVLISRRGPLAKHDTAPAIPSPAKHPHTDGAIPKKDSPEVAANDQAAGKGVATYRQYALPFGTIKQGEKSNLFHYDYRGKQDAANKLVADHGFQTYYAGGKYGRPDLANRNYNTKHLMVYDPTPASGGDFGDEGYTDAWRKTHELAHALTYPDVNKLYGEGRRIGKLGAHRTQREALRAVHWEWLAAHKQRELSKQLGIEIPDEVFHKELNTVMHDAAHRAVTGKFTEPSDEGFNPHSHKVPLETSLGLVRDAARNLGLQGDHDLVRKSEGAFVVANEKKELSVDEMLRGLHKGLKARVNDFAQEALKLRKREQEGLAKAEAKLSKALPGELSKQPVSEGTAPPPAPPAPPVIKDEMNPMAEGGANMSMAEMSALCKACGMKKDADGDHDCDKAESYAKGEMPTATKPVKGDFDEGSGGDITKGKKLGKAAMPAAGAAPAAPKPAGAAPTMPKIGAPAVGGMPKPAAAGGMPKMPGAATKAPAMGAGVPTAKKELAKAGPSILGDRSMAARKKFGERTQKEQAAKLPGVQASVGNLMDNMLTAPSPAPEKKAVNDFAAKQGVSLHPMGAAKQAVKLPGARAEVSNTMDSMLAATAKAPQAAPLAPGAILPATPGAVPGVGAAAPKPAQGVQTMAERVASKMPTKAQATSGLKLPGEHLFAGPPAAAGTKAPAVQQHLSKLPAKPAAVPPPSPAAAMKSEKPIKKSDYGLALKELGTCAMCKSTEHVGPCA